MNLFYLSKSAKKAVKYHCDKHVVKMILETVQMAYTALNVLYGPSSGNSSSSPLTTAPMTKSGSRGYKSTHTNHPMTLWFRTSLANFQWGCDFGVELCAEYTHRYGKQHACQEHIEWLSQQKFEIEEDPGLTAVPQCMPDKYKVEGDSVQAYRNFYIGDKAEFCRWTNREVPEWWISAMPSDHVSLTKIEKTEKKKRVKKSKKKKEGDDADTEEVQVEAPAVDKKKRVRKAASSSITKKSKKKKTEGDDADTEVPVVVKKEEEEKNERPKRQRKKRKLFD